jgi:hypothetical protein
VTAPNVETVMIPDRFHEGAQIWCAPWKRLRTFEEICGVFQDAHLVEGLRIFEAGAHLRISCQGSKTGNPWGEAPRPQFLFVPLSFSHLSPSFIARVAPKAKEIRRLRRFRRFEFKKSA